MELKVPLELIRKYSTRGPRYTSYPTAVEFTPTFQKADWERALAEEFFAEEPRTSLYFHVPFCRKLCFFCACNKEVTQNRAVVPPFLESVRRELAYYAGRGSKLQIEQLHWGGGSPNYLTPDEMGQLIAATREVFPVLLPDADVSIELDPRTTTVEQLQVLRAAGFNRVSLGVQDFNPEVQRAVQRVQSYEETAALCASARALGFRSVGIDVIYGLPCQTQESFEATLERVLEIRPDRVAMYGYADVTWLKEAQKTLERKYHLPTPEERVVLFLAGLRFFTAAGYEYIGMDHFALPEDSLAQALSNGRLNRNFMGYSTHQGTRILAFGPSAISALRWAYAQNQKEVQAYEAGVAADGLAIERGLRKSEDDRCRGELIERLMCVGRISIPEFEARWKVDFCKLFGPALTKLEPFKADELIEISAEDLRLTTLGRVFMRNVAMPFDAYLEAHQKGAKPVFSQAV